MKTINSFSLSKLTDNYLSKLTNNDLSKLAAECFAEQERRERRERERKEERQKWIDGYYCAFLCHSNASVAYVGETIVVALWNRDLGIRIGTATPVHGDVFDHNTGIAVAYAKAIGNKIPDYI